MNSVQLIGNLTRDPETRALPSGSTVCSMRLAVNGRRKNTAGNWEEKPNFFDVTAFGALADTCAGYLAKGRRVALTGRLEHREWDAEEGKRSAVEIVASDIDFLTPRPSENEPGDAAEVETALA